MKPTAEFAQHHDVEPPRVDATAFRQGWRVRTRLDALLAAGAISLVEWYAAILYRTTWEAAHLSPAAPEIRHGTRRPTDHFTVRRLDALATLRAIRARIGVRACRLIEACVVEDRTWADIGLRRGIDRKTARVRTIWAIKRLARLPRNGYQIGRLD